jgi:hypothetical protein
MPTGDQLSKNFCPFKGINAVRHHPLFNASCLLFNFIVMPRKNLLALHESIAVALLNQPDREGTFDEIATFIEERNLYPNRDGNIPLSTQVMLRSTKSGGHYRHLFEQVGAGKIRLACP